MAISPAPAAGAASASGRCSAAARRSDSRSSVRHSQPTRSALGPGLIELMCWICSVAVKRVSASSSTAHAVQRQCRAPAAARRPAGTARSRRCSRPARAGPAACRAAPGGAAVRWASGVPACARGRRCGAGSGTSTAGSGLQRAAARAAHQQQVLQVELQLDVVEVGHGHGLVGSTRPCCAGLLSSPVRFTRCWSLSKDHSSDRPPHGPSGALSTSGVLPSRSWRSSERISVGLSTRKSAQPAGGRRPARPDGCPGTWRQTPLHGCGRVSAGSCACRPSGRPGPAARARPGGGSRRR
jgi:hypothetical protein